MSGSQYDFRSALSSEPEPSAEGEEGQAELFTALTSQVLSSPSGSGAPLSLNLASGLLLMGNRSGSMEVDTANQRVAIDPDSPDLVERRDGDVVLGATDEGAQLPAGQAVEGEALQPMIISKAIPASEGVSASASFPASESVSASASFPASESVSAFGAADPGGEATEPQETPVHVVSVREPDPSDLAEDFSSTEGTPLTEAVPSEFTPMVESAPAAEAVPASASIDATPEGVPGEQSNDSVDATGPVVTVDPETGETVILAEDLRITVGPENGQVRIEPSDENVPLAEDAPPITVDAGGLTMVIDPGTGTLEVQPIKGEFTDITVEVGDLRLVMDGETGEISIDPAEGSVSVDPETGLVTIEPPIDEDAEGGDAGPSRDDTDRRSPEEDQDQHHPDGKDDHTRGDDHGGKGSGDEAPPEDSGGAHDDEDDQELLPDEGSSGEGSGRDSTGGGGPGGAPGGAGVPRGGSGGEDETEDQAEDSDEPDPLIGSKASADGGGSADQDGSGDGGGDSGGGEETQSRILSPDDEDEDSSDGDGDKDNSGSSGGDDDKDKDDEDGDDGEDDDGNSDSKSKGNTEDGTGIDASELTNFQKNYLEPFDRKLSEEIPKFVGYSSSGREGGGPESVRLGEGKKLFSVAAELAQEINTSMNKVREILTGMRKEINDIDKRIKENINKFEILEEDQVFSAREIESLFTGNNSPPSSPSGYGNYGPPSESSGTEQRN